MPRISTIQLYDKPLRWRKGSAVATWTGGNPIPLPGTETPTAEQLFILGPAAVALEIERLTTLLDIASALHDAVDAAGPSPLRTAVADATDQLDCLVSGVTASWVTEFLERNVASGQPLHPSLEVVFRAHLTAPVDLEEADAHGKLYRRFLLGHGDHVDADLESVFQRRLAARRSAELSRDPVARGS